MNYQNIHISVCLEDLSSLADLICDRGTRESPPTLENIGACHNLIIKMAGDHASKIYADDADSEKAAA